MVRRPNMISRRPWMYIIVCGWLSSYVQAMICWRKNVLKSFIVNYPISTSRIIRRRWAMWASWLWGHQASCPWGMSLAASVHLTETRSFVSSRSCELSLPWYSWMFSKRFFKKGWANIPFCISETLSHVPKTLIFSVSNRSSSFAVTFGQHWPINNRNGF